MVAGYFALPAAIICICFLYSVPLGLVLLGLFIIYAFLVPRRLLREHRQRDLQMLCATEYATAKGYRPESLRTFSFPWSR